MTRPVVVAGLGVVGPFGCGRAALAAALARGAPAPTTVVEAPAGWRRSRSARRAALVGPQDLGEWISPGAARRMSPPSRFGVAAAKLALADAGLDAGTLPGTTACVLATSFGPTTFTERLLRQILLEGAEAASPSLFTECVANAPAAQIAIAVGAQGPNITITQREAGPLTALARGAALVSRGQADRALVAVTEEMSPLLHVVLDRFGALARPEVDRGDEVARPFDKRRSGFVAAEGAVVALLEPQDGATRRGAGPLARIAAYGGAFDASAAASGWGDDGAGLGRALALALRKAGIERDSIDRIVSGASGARQGDRLEARTLRALWPDRAIPPVLAPKATTGEYGGGFLAAAILAAAGAPFGPTPGFGEADEELDVVPHDGGPLPAPRRVLVTGLAAGGCAAWLVLDSP